MSIKNITTHVAVEQVGAPGKYSVPHWTQFQRWLLMGSQGGAYYASEKQLTVENVSSLKICVAENGVRTVKMIVELSESGRAPKNDQAIFALAYALKNGDVATKLAAKAAVPKVCRIGTHLFQFAECVKTLGGWGSSTKKAFAGWYNDQSDKDLAYQLVKYQNRGGWSHRDLLLKAHVKPKTETRSALYAWASDKQHKAAVIEDVAKKSTKWVLDEREHTNWLSTAPSDEAQQILWAFERAKVAKSADEIVTLINKYGLPRECIPTQFLNDVSVWAALLDNRGHGMGYTAMIRNLGKMTSIGLASPMSDASKQIAFRLADSAAVQKARIHPMNVLIALRTYGHGHGEKGSLSWNPDPKILKALDTAFYGSFKNIEPSGKRHLIALDVSGSMGSPCGGLPITCREASAVMAMATVRTEENYHVMGFSNQFISLPLNPSMSLEQVVQKISGLPFNSTDCSLPFVWAQKNKVSVDLFAVFTDSETNYNTVAPSQALADYRKDMGIEARSVVCAMVANNFSIADKNDPLMLDLAGLDSATPGFVADFAAGRI